MLYQRLANIDLKDGWLLYSIGTQEPQFDGDWRVTKLGRSRDALTPFMEIALAGEQAIGAFVDRCGPLGICQHDDLPTHSCGGRHEEICHARKLKGNRFKEPISVYLRLAAQVRAWMDIAWVLNETELTINDRSMLATPWEILKPNVQFYATPEDRREPDFPHDATVGFHMAPRRRQRDEMASQLNGWLVRGHLSPHLEYKKDGWGLEMQGSVISSWGSVALCLIPYLTGGKRMFLCGECGHAYLPQRAPSEGRRNFCSSKDCQRAAARYRQQKLRQV